MTVTFMFYISIIIINAIVVCVFAWSHKVYTFVAGDKVTASLFFNTTLSLVFQMLLVFVEFFFFFVPRNFTFWELSSRLY